MRDYTMGEPDLCPRCEKDYADHACGYTFEKLEQSFAKVCAERAGLLTLIRRFDQKYGPFDEFAAVRHNDGTGSACSS